MTKKQEVYFAVIQDLMLAFIINSAATIINGGFTDTWVSIMDAVKIMKEERSYAENIVPCRSTCPAHIDIPRYIRYIKNGEFEKATAVVREKVPFPETLGSVCTHACESECKRNELGVPISICKLKRAAAHEDTGEWKARSVKLPPTGKKAAVIGAGPAGLTAAYYLAKKGHQVTVFEKNEKAGGQCRYGIPAYRLPDDLLDKEINDILETGIELKCGEAAPAPADLLKHARMGTPLPVGERVKKYILPVWKMSSR